MATLVDALVLTCMDHRLHRADRPYLADFLRGKYVGVKTWDLLTTPGACRDLVVSDAGPPARSGFAAGDAGGRRDVLIRAIKLAHDAHHVAKLVIVNHSDCAAYGGRSAFPDETAEYRTHAADLRAVRESLRTVFPNLDTRLFYGTIEDRAAGPFVTYDEVR